MVLILVGNSDIGVRVRRNLCYLICLSDQYKYHGCNKRLIICYHLLVLRIRNLNPNSIGVK